MIPTLLILMLLTSIMLGLSLIAIGGYVWLAAKKRIPGILLLVVGLILTSLPIALIAFFTITTSARGWLMMKARTQVTYDYYGS